MTQIAETTTDDGTKDAAPMTDAAQMPDPSPEVESTEAALRRLHLQGLVAVPVALADVATYLLMRDRARGDDPELAELVASVRDVGLSNPIRVEARADGKYELIQGFRRLSAFRALLAETGDALALGAIPAIIMPRGEAVATQYRRMVDENMVRKDISFAEMAQMAISYAADPFTADHDAEKAVAVLFRSASYSKRSYIRGFLPLMESLGEHLQFAQHIPRDLGLKLSEALAEQDGLASRLRAELKAWDNRSVSDELTLLRRAVGLVADGDSGTASRTAPERRVVMGGGAKTIFQVATRRGGARCTAGQGLLVIRSNRDFAAMDRRTLEGAVRSMLDTLI